MEFIDTHCHLDAAEFDADRNEVINRAVACGVTQLICIGASEGFASNQRALALATKHPQVFAAVGLHPNDAKIPTDKHQLLTYANHAKVVAIGETGLDFYRTWAPQDLQELWFRTHIEVAIELKLPLVIHSRDSALQCLEILEATGAAKVGGVFHCYSESADFAARLKAINFLISITGIVTFPKAQALRDALMQIPLEQVMLETDAPYLAPVPYRGKRCESAYLVDTAKCLAAIYQLDLAEVARVTTTNAKRLFKLDS